MGGLTAASDVAAPFAQAPRKFRSASARMATTSSEAAAGTTSRGPEYAAITALIVACQRRPVQPAEGPHQRGRSRPAHVGGELVAAEQEGVGDDVVGGAERHQVLRCVDATVLERYHAVQVHAAGEGDQDEFGRRLVGADGAFQLACCLDPALLAEWSPAVCVRPRAPPPTRSDSVRGPCDDDRQVRETTWSGCARLSENPEDSRGTALNGIQEVTSSILVGSTLVEGACHEAWRLAKGGTIEPFAKNAEPDSSAAVIVINSGKSKLVGRGGGAAGPHEPVASSSERVPLQPALLGRPPDEGCEGRFPHRSHARRRLRPPGPMRPSVATRAIDGGEDPATVTASFGRRQPQDGQAVLGRPPPRRSG